MDKKIEKKGKDKFLIIILAIIIAMVAIVFIADMTVTNKVKNMGKNVKYYEQTGEFDELNKEMILKKYKFTENEYSTFKSLASKVESEIKKNNISSADILYRKVRENDLGSEYIVIRGNSIYITISTKETTIDKANDSMFVIQKTVGEYYDEIFAKAKNDTNYNSLIYFNNIENLKELL